MSLMSALLLALSQSPMDLGFLAIVALVPWLLATHRAGAIESVVLGTLTGVGYGIVSANWLFAAFESQGVFGFRNVLAILVVTFWAKGLLFGAMGWGTWRLRDQGPLLQVFVLGASFGMGELWISESRWGLPLQLLGHSQISVLGVAQLAVIAGVPGISAFLFAINCAIACLFQNRRRNSPAAAGLVAAWTASALCGLPLAVLLRAPPDSEIRSLLLIQPSISRDRRWDPAFQKIILDEIAAYTGKVLDSIRERPDAILWPENLLTTPMDRSVKLERRFEAYIDGWGVPVVTGLVRSSTSGGAGDYRNSVVWWSPQIGLRDAIDKVRAIPLIESNRKFFGHTMLTQLIGEAARGPRVAESLDARPLNGEFTLSPVLCFEVLFPRIVAERRSNESVAIINFADDSWVSGETVDVQLLSAAAFRAIEQRLTLIRVAHGGLSVVIDPFGLETASLPPDVYSHRIIEVSTTAPTSTIERAAVLALPTITGWATWLVWIQFIHRNQPLEQSEQSYRL